MPCESTSQSIIDPHSNRQFKFTCSRPSLLPHRFPPSLTTHNTKSMPEIKPEPRATNNDAMWAWFRNHQRLVVDTGTANLLISLIKKVQGLPVHSHVPSAVVSQLASEIDAELLRAKGLREVQIQLLRKLPLVKLCMVQQKTHLC